MDLIVSVPEFTYLYYANAQVHRNHREAYVFCLIVFVFLSLSWCEHDVDLLVSVPEFFYLLYCVNA